MKKVLLCMALVLAFGYAEAQKRSPWREASAEKLSNVERIKDEVYSGNQKLLQVDMQAFKQSLASATEVGSGKGTVITLPTVNGDEQFNVWETSNFAPALRAQYPDIKSYVGRGVTDKAAYIRFSLAPETGLSTMVLRPNNASEFIEPYTKDHSVYVAFDSKSRMRNRLPFNCSTDDVQINQELMDRVNSETQRADNQVFKTYRLALSCTAEYTTFFGGTVNGALAGMNATMTRVNGVFDVDMAMKLEIIAGTTSVIYTNAGTDPYSAAAVGSNPANANNANGWNIQLQNALTNTLGNAAYDIGHLFGASGGGGNAGCIGCICEDDTTATTDKHKGSGYTSPSDNIPQGDTFDIDYVIHEMGHQLGANHTFSHAVEGAGVNLETGSGVTIMGYAGVTINYDVQSHSIPIFLYRSIMQMQTNLALAAHNCSTNVVLANTPPVVSAGSNWTIPIGTAFILTGTGSDADGDTLSYTWEQNDNGTNATTADNSFASGTKTVGPNWRNWMPTAQPVRILPQLSAVLQGTLEGSWESVSTVGRNLNFSLTARDNRPNGGQTKRDNMVVTVSALYGPFEVTSQATAGISWTQGSTQTITWNVANTTALPGSANVNIKMSTDGGVTWPHTLASNTPNDGSENIIVPAVTGQNCRIWIQPTDHIYFAVNDKQFSIGYDCNITTANPNLFVPDGGTPVLTPLTVATAGTIDGATMKVNLQVNHAYVGDLIIKLIHPDGTIRNLWNRGCNSAQFSNLSLTFQTGGLLIGNNCATISNGLTYAPNQAFSGFNGKPTNGTWQLSIEDEATPDEGTVVSWGLDFGCTLGTPGVDQADFAIYPNPNTGNFSIQYTSPTMGDVAVTVHDIRGRKVFENKYTNTGMFMQNISLNSAETGIYLVTVQDGNKKMVKKIVVE